MCPACRAELIVSPKANFKRVLELVQSTQPLQGTSPGRHLPILMHTLGSLYRIGEGVEIDLEQAYKWTRAAAEQGYEIA